MGCEVKYNGEIILQGWRDTDSWLWSVSLFPDGSNTDIPDDTTQGPSNMHLPQRQVHSTYECENTDELINFCYATMGYIIK